MESTPELRKQLRKKRRADAKHRAHITLRAVAQELGLSLAPTGEATYGSLNIRDATTGSLAALVRLGRRMLPAIQQGQNELRYRYESEAGRREAIMRRAYRQLWKDAYAKFDDPNEQVARFLKTAYFDTVHGRWRWNAGKFLVVPPGEPKL